MALLFMAGAGSGDPTFEGQRWGANGGSINMGAIATGVRFADHVCYRGSGGAFDRSALAGFTAASEVYASVWLRHDSVWNIGLRGDSRVTTHLTLVGDPGAGTLTLRRGTSAGTVLQTVAHPVGTTDGHHYQVRATISDTVGICQVRVDGATVNLIDYTGDTRNGGTATTVDGLYLFGNLGGLGTFLFGDVAVNDTTGTVNNSWPGDCRVQVRRPNGNGSFSQAVGSDGNSTDNYLLVDEVPWSTTDYVGTPTVGQGDTYPIAPLINGTTTVRGVQVISAMGKSDAGVMSGRVRLRSGGTAVTGTTRGLNTTQTMYTDLWQTNPATSTVWTESTASGIEVGFEAV